MKVDLSAIVARPSLKSDEIKIFDLHEDIADHIYQEGVTDQEYNFAIKVYQEGSGIMDLSDKEIAILERSISNYPFWLKRAISDSISGLNQTVESNPDTQSQEVIGEGIIDMEEPSDSPQPNIVSAADVVKPEESSNKKSKKKK